MVEHKRGKRGKNKGHGGKNNGLDKLKPLTLCVNFEKRVSPAMVKMLVDNIDDAVAIKMGKYIKVDFNSQKEAADAKKQLMDIKCEIGQIVVDYASKNKNKRVGEDIETPAKKAKMEGSDMIEEKDEDEDEEEEEGEDEDEDEEGEGEEDEDEEGEEDEDEEGEEDEDEEGEEDEDEEGEEEGDDEEETEDSNEEVDEDGESSDDDNDSDSNNR